MTENPEVAISDLFIYVQLSLFFLIFYFFLTCLFFFFFNAVWHSKSGLICTDSVMTYPTLDSCRVCDPVWEMNLYVSICTNIAHRQQAISSIFQLNQCILELTYFLSCQIYTIWKSKWKYFGFLHVFHPNEVNILKF